MALGWPSLSQAELEKGQLRPGILLRIECTPIVRVWAGVGALTIDIDNIETEPTNLYRGVGEFLNPPVVSQLVNGVAERVEFQLSGDAVTAQIAALVRADASVVRSSSVFLGFLLFGPDLQPVTPTAWLWEGVADSMSDSWDGTSGDVQRSISLSVGSMMTGRKRPQNSYFTDADQKRRWPTDDVFDQLNKYEVGTFRVWPI